MTVTEEGGGRLNIFAKEPEIQIIESKSSLRNRFRLFALACVIILISIFGWYFINK